MSDGIRIILIISLCGLSIISAFYNLVAFKHVGFVDILRPIIVVLLYRVQRSTAKLIVINLQDSLAVITIIFVSIFIWSYFAMIIFKYSFSDVAYFDTVGDSLW